MRALSLDASTTCVGWALFNDDDLLEYGRLVPTEGKLDWRERCENLAPQLDELIEKAKPEIIYQEAVPRGGSGGVTTGIQLGFVQGILYMVEKVMNNLPVKYIEVGTWRKDIGISTGDSHRDMKKIKSIEKANELFGLGLEIEYTKSGNFKPTGADDISDAVLIYASTRDKYRKPLAFGKRRG